jgi:Mg2+ and Co2+ transporter CorA
MFNLKEAKAKKARVDLDKHIEKMLEDYTSKYKDVLKSVETEEALLERQRTGKGSDLTERLLDNRRTESSHMTTEKLLDSKKSLYSKHRVERSDSEVPPLEAKRLSTKPIMEDEDYDSAVSEK